MKKFIILGLIILVVTGVIFIFNILNSSLKSLSQAEKETAIAKILGRKPNLTDDTPKGDTQYKGKYASFMYPAKAKIYTYVDTNFAQHDSLLETFSFDIYNPRLIFNFSVVENTANLRDVSEISGVKLRQDQTRGYKQLELTIDGYTGLIFEKDGNQPEKTGFFLVNNKIYSIAITGNNYKEIVNLFDNLVGTIIFQ